MNWGQYKLVNDKRETKKQISFIVSFAFIVSRIQIRAFVNRFVYRSTFLVYRFTYTNYKSNADDKRKTERETNELYRRPVDKISLEAISTT